MAGTTRDAVDSVVEQDGTTFRFVDTAGIRRKGKTELKAEKLSVVMARRHMEQSDVAILLIDGTQGVTAVDAHIGGYAHEAHRSVIIVVNKWDVVQKSHSITADFERDIREKLKFLSFAPIVFISAKTGQRVQKLFGTIKEVYAARFLRVPTSELNELFRAGDVWTRRSAGGCEDPLHRAGEDESADVRDVFEQAFEASLFV